MQEPSAKAVSFYRLGAEYGAVNFEKCLSMYIVRLNNSQASPASVCDLVSTLCLGFQKVPVYHKVKFWESDFSQYRHASDEYNVIHVTPAHSDKRGNIIPGQFDTVLVNLGNGVPVGITSEYQL
ncbi:uncharacterized protein PHACADRAFT_33048 [Phanerochaete carnosa HHB-10118-sp]|uniref:Uncharacterized protein n=1 Tax=Phanerochaete carnosa (strain HHB-10118-sp) TaxID=650164 RepID=K5VGC7_PHACS|nr:uncharacterized protein PHACADRAFT_33048 [Phanerochaete carnosa HHB-10118-sp]EKM50268.1 hypothetical protein PHACADRAFT_33048 [Phanerochaete carnosa HHB-10118-sp]